MERILKVFSSLVLLCYTAPMFALTLVWFAGHQPGDVLGQIHIVANNLCGCGQTFAIPITTPSDFNGSCLTSVQPSMVSCDTVKTATDTNGVILQNVATWVVDRPRQCIGEATILNDFSVVSVSAANRTITYKFNNTGATFTYKLAALPPGTTSCIHAPAIDSFLRCT